MTNRDILKEFIWFLISVGLSFLLTILIMPTNYDSMIATMLNVDGLIADAAFKIRLLIGFLLFFPILFILTSIREGTKKFTRRPQNIYLLLICIISILSNFISLAFLKPLATVMFGSWTIYPPLSVVPNEFHPPTNFDTFYYCIITLMTIQAIVTVITSRQVFKNKM